MRGTGDREDVVKHTHFSTHTSFDIVFDSKQNGMLYKIVGTMTSRATHPLHHTRTIVLGNSPKYPLQPAVTSLQESEPQLGLTEDVHASQVPDHSQTRRQLDVGLQLLDQLGEHHLEAAVDVLCNVLQ